MGNMSPWAVKRLDEFGGDISKFSVIKLHPSKLRQICVAKTEPGDENNQDISALVGKVDIRKLEHFGQNDADAYSYSGGLNRTTQGVLEFVEMFKAPLKMLHPLLTATQDRTYVGTENVGAHALPGPHHRPLQRERVAELPRQQEQRGVPRPHQRHQGSLLPARHGGEEDLREAAGGSELQGGRHRARHARDAGALLGAVRGSRRTRTRRSSPRCASTTARA